MEYSTLARGACAPKHVSPFDKAHGRQGSSFDAKNTIAADIVESSMMFMGVYVLGIE